MKDELRKKPWYKAHSVLFAFTCAIVVILISAFYFERSAAHAPIDNGFYAAALKSASTTQSVIVQGVPYVVVDGTVYRSGTAITGSGASAPLLLAYEKTVAQRSPLIALAGTDPSRLDAAISQLQITAQDMASLQPDRPTQVEVNDLLYPIDFLQRASALEDARQAFIASGSDIDALTYQEDQDEAVQAYLADLENYERGFMLTVPQNAPPYIMEKNYTDYDVVISAITQLRSGMDTTRDALAKRDQCFSGVTSACEISDLALPSLVVPPQQPPVSPERMQSLLSKLQLPPLHDKLAGTDLEEEPYLELASPGCTGNPAVQQVFLLRIAPLSTSTSYKNPLLITADRLVDATKQGDVPFFKYFADRGVKYVPSTPLVYYECVNYTSDSSQVFSMDTVLDYAQAMSLSRIDPATASKAAALERAFAARPQPITDHDTTLYASLAQEAAFDGTLPARYVPGAYDLALGVADESTEYDSQILNIAELEQTNVRLYKEGVPVGLDAADIFYTRSGLVTFFMADNPSVSGPHTDLYPVTSVPDDQPYVYYSLLSPAQQKVADYGQEFYFLLHSDPSFVPPPVSNQ